MTDMDLLLTSAEADWLADCEATIERGVKTFVEVGTALASVRDNRLYRAEFATFEDYCQTRWGFTRVRAFQMIEAASTTLTIVNSGLPAPTNEGQARELGKVDPEQRADVWTETVRRTAGKPTAAAVREVRQEREPITPDLDDIEPAVQPKTDAQLDAELDASMADTATRFRRNFSGELVHLGRLWIFDPERVAEVYAADFDRNVNETFEMFTTWMDKVRAAHRRQVSGLRLIAGGEK